MPPYTRSARAKHGYVDPGNIVDEDTHNNDFEMTECITIASDEDVTMTEAGSDKGDASVVQDETATPEPKSSNQDRLIIAVDFGTTFSSIAYVRLKRGVPTLDIDLDDVDCIGNFPNYRPPPGIPSDRQDVPTELWYDPGGRIVNPLESIGEYLPTMNTATSDSRDPLSENEDSVYDEDSVVEIREQEQQQDHLSNSGTQYWGFSVKEQLRESNIPKSEARPLSRFKLTLDVKKETEEVRHSVNSTLSILKERKFIKRDDDIFTHFLTHLLSHAKHELESRGVLHSQVVVEFVLCVPAKWPSKGCRTMQAAMVAAVKEAGFGEQARHSISNLFMISEPEAAAACVLADGANSIFCNETVVILDAGGGTVDAVTYQCTLEFPLRLSAEVVAPNSALCGASYIDERFENLLAEKLRPETYLVKNGKTLRSIVEAKSIEFENGEKRRVDTTKRGKTIPPIPILVDDLREDRSRRFYQNRLYITQQVRRRSTSWIMLTKPSGEIDKVFKESLRGARKTLHEQLALAKSAGKVVGKVILTGGFGQSRALQSYLREYLDRKINYSIAGTKIALVVPRNPSTAVAQGAVLRALNKEHGPDRISQCSYGYLSSEPYQPDACPAHKQAKWMINKADGEKYVHQTINWVIQAGDHVPNKKMIVEVVKHTFSISCKKLLCEEVLYVSDDTHESHYRRIHPLNKGAEKAGVIVADMTFLKEEGRIEPSLPSKFSTYSNMNRRHWAVEFELVMIVEGRSLRFEARWPKSSDLQANQQQEVQASSQVCIAAAFQPGTA